MGDGANGIINKNRLQPHYRQQGNLSMKTACSLLRITVLCFVAPASALLLEICKDKDKDKRKGKVKGSKGKTIGYRSTTTQRLVEDPEDALILQMPDTGEQADEYEEGAYDYEEGAGEYEEGDMHGV